MNAKPSFRDAFCAYYQCAPENFPAQALFRLVPREARMLVHFLWRVQPALFAVDLEILEILGEAADREELRAVGARVEAEYRRRRSYSWWRQLLGIFISPQQVGYAAMRIWPKGATRSSGQAVVERSNQLVPAG